MSLQVNALATMVMLEWSDINDEDGTGHVERNVVGDWPVICLKYLPNAD